MINISLRLPDELARKLERETRLERRGRSEIVREALDRYLTEKERARFMADMVREARAVYGDAENVAAAREMSEEFLPAENEALERTEGAPEVSEVSPDQWWK